MTRKANAVETTALETILTAGDVAQVETPKEVFNYTKAIETFKSKSGVIRGLHADGKSCKEIYKLLTEAKVTNNDGTHPIRYQHVRNVLNTPVKKIAS